MPAINFPEYARTIRCPSPLAATGGAQAHTGRRVGFPGADADSTYG